MGLAVFALLATYATMAWTASLEKGQSFDEGLQLAVGYNIWLNRDFRMEGANGDFVKRWATLPFLLTRPKFVEHNDRFWKTGAPYELGHRFFFQLGNQPEFLLLQGRAMIVVLGVATGLLVFAWARALFGTTGGLISLGLFAFSPHMLAFGAIVSTDLSITLLLFASATCVWRLLHAITWARLLTSLVVFGLLVLAKPSALVILPITAVLAAVKLLSGGVLHTRLLGGRRILTSRKSQATAFGTLTCLHALTAFGAVWAHYSFRYAASPNPSDPTVQISSLKFRDGTAEPLRKILAWMRSSRAVPEGFHHGLHQLVGNDDQTISFMDGEWTVGGRPGFFPYTIWVKTPPPLFILLIGGVVAWCWMRHGSRPGGRARLAVFPPLYAAAPLLALIGCYLAVALIDDLNIGHRHVLPIYPALYVLAGAAGLLATRLRRAGRVAFVAAVLAWPLAEAVHARPDYLAYFGPQTGGSDEAYQHLVDSSLDWGMDLPALKQWIDANDPGRRTPLFLAYFGTDSPRYHGIGARRLPGFYDRRPIEAYPLAPGCYAISATLLQSVYTAAFGPWSKGYEKTYQEALQRMRMIERQLPATVAGPGGRGIAVPESLHTLVNFYDALRFGRLCAWLRNGRPPDARAGQSILIWKLSLEELLAATVGPPAELTDTPVPTWHYARKVPAW